MFTAKDPGRNQRRPVERDLPAHNVERLQEAAVGTARAWLAMQSAHDLAAERAAGLPAVRKVGPVA